MTRKRQEKDEAMKTMKMKSRLRRGMASLEAVLVVAIALPMAAWTYHFVMKMVESLFYLIGTVVGSAPAGDPSTTDDDDWPW